MRHIKIPSKGNIVVLGYIKATFTLDKACDTIWEEYVDLLDEEGITFPHVIKHSYEEEM